VFEYGFDAPWQTVFGLDWEVGCASLAFRFGGEGDVAGLGWDINVHLVFEV
jgi:hypothetical protein